jgi:hypothetical protein
MNLVSSASNSALALACITALACTTSVRGNGEGPSLSAGDLSLRAVHLQPASTEELADAPAPPGRFGAAGSEYLIIGTGLAHNFIDAWDFNLHGAYSQFLIDDVELSFEVHAWYFDQDGDDALGINPSIVFRWHLIHLPDRPWTIFTDVGIGLLLATDNVPAGGTWLDFTPRVGLGYTHQIADDGTRLQIGGRWHHISNARITGDRQNPARDGLMLYGGVMFPF